ncbi:MAG: hypothetical protein ACJAR1_000194 [Rubritalea sp.]|jgi:hypothetical protein
MKCDHYTTLFFTVTSAELIYFYNTMILTALKRLFLLASFALTVIPCSAQDSGKVALQFLSLPRLASPEPIELSIGEGKTITVEIPSNSLSKVYNVKLQSNWIFGKSTTNKKDEPVFDIFGQAKALSSPKQLILLIRKGEKKSDGFEVLVIDNRVSKFGGGKFLFMNMAKIDIAGIIGEQKFVIEPSKFTIIKPKPEKPGARVCHVRLFYSKNNKAKPFFSSKWPLSIGSRGLIFFYHDPKTKQLRYHSIRDFL